MTLGNVIGILGGLIILSPKGYVRPPGLQSPRAGSPGVRYLLGSPSNQQTSWAQFTGLVLSSLSRRQGLIYKDWAFLLIPGTETSDPLLFSFQLFYNPAQVSWPPEVKEN